MEKALRLQIEDIHKDMSVSFTCVLTDAMIDTFAGFSSDYSPIHMDGEYAEKHGYKTRVVHGAIFNALFSQLIGMHCPGALAILHSLNAKYHNPSYPGDEVVVSGTVEHVSTENKVVLMSLCVHNKNDGEIRVKAKAQVGIMNEQV